MSVRASYLKKELVQIELPVQHTYFEDAQVLELRLTDAEKLLYALRDLIVKELGRVDV